MKKFLALTVVIGFVSMMSGCATTYGGSTYGGIVSSNVKGPVAVGDQTVGWTKTGTSQSTAIVVFASGDASITAAMNAGGIKKIHHVDNETFSVLGFYATYKTIVYGE
jgi:hypothetical protein